MTDAYKITLKSNHL